MQRAIILLREVYFAWQGEEFDLGPCKGSSELICRLIDRLDREMTHLRDRDGNYCPAALARSMGYGYGDDDSNDEDGDECQHEPFDSDGYLVRLAQEDPRAFCGLLKRCLPSPWPLTTTRTGEQSPPRASAHGPFH